MPVFKCEVTGIDYILIFISCLTCVLTQVEILLYDELYMIALYYIHLKLIYDFV